MSEGEEVLSIKERMKGKAVEQGEGGAVLDQSLNLSLNLNDNPLKVDHDEPNIELNLLGSLGTDPHKGSSGMSHAAAAAAAEAKEVAPTKFFLCRYCNRRFSNCQALGGHQNAHKRERAAIRNDKEVDNGVTWDQQPNPYYMAVAAPPAGFSNHHSHGTFHRSPLGVNMHSVIHKPHQYHHHHHHHHPYALHNPQYPMHWVPNSGLQVPLEHVGISRSMAPFGTIESSSLANSGAVAARNMTALAGQPNLRRAAAAGFAGTHQQCEPTVTGPNLSLKL